MLSPADQDTRKQLVLALLEKGMVPERIVIVVPILMGVIQGQPPSRPLPPPIPISPPPLARQNG